MNIGKNNQDYQSNTEENFNSQRKFSRENSRDISNHNRQEKKEDDDDIMALIRNQIKIQYPQKPE